MPNYDSDYEPSVVSTGRDDREWEEAMRAATRKDKKWERSVVENGLSLTVTLRRVKGNNWTCK